MEMILHAHSGLILRNMSASRLHAIMSNTYAVLKPRLHQIHVAGYTYPGRATCIRLHVDGYKF